jgi:apolipoprotein N-acyltransferase
MRKKAQKFSMRNLYAPCASAFMLALAFSRFNLGFLAWIALVPLLVSLDKLPRWQRWKKFFIFALLFFAGILYWIHHVSFLGLCALCIFLALEFSLLGLVIPCSSSKSSLLFIPLLWILFERIRGVLFFGFGWGLLGYTQFRNIILIQNAEFVGVLGISFLIVLINTAIAQAVLCKWRFNLKTGFVAIPCWIILLSYVSGYFLFRVPIKTPDLAVSLIQANVPQEQKWDTRYTKSIMEKFSRLSKAAAKNNPDLIIWPETSVPGYLLDEPKLFIKTTELAKELNSYLLNGSPREDYVKRAFFNTAFLFRPDGHLQQYHDKIHLVPFGEYIPYKRLFGFLENTTIADFAAGKEYTIFKMKNKQGKIVRFGVLICFEDIFPSLVRSFRKKGADFLITITNEAWFKHSSEPIQHTAMSVFRAIENRCWFIRCANTGISCFIDPQGRIRKKIEHQGKDIFIEGTATMRLGN